MNGRPSRPEDGMAVEPVSGYAIYFYQRKIQCLLDVIVVIVVLQPLLLNRSVNHAASSTHILVAVSNQDVSLFVQTVCNKPIG